MRTAHKAYSKRSVDDTAFEKGDCERWHYLEWTNKDFDPRDSSCLLLAETQQCQMQLNKGSLGHMAMQR